MIVFEKYVLSHERALIEIIADRDNLIEQLYMELLDKGKLLADLQEQLKAKSKEEPKVVDPVNRDWEAEEEKSDGHTDDPSA